VHLLRDSLSAGKDGGGLKLVIGCGNTNRVDDGAGTLVACQLRTLGLNAIVHCGDGWR
jgi:Ni,Fe-hydrogenase maturation factor